MTIPREMTGRELEALADRVAAETLVQFAQKRGLKTDYDLRSHIHAGLRSAPTTKTYARWDEQETARLMSQAAETCRLYEEAISRGEIARPKKPSLDEIAAGDPDNTATQAAKRLLAKRAARASAAPVIGGGE